MGSGKGSSGIGVNRVNGQPVVSGHQQGVVEIEIGSTPQFRDHKVDRGEDAHAQVRLIDEVGGAVTITRRHRDHRPPGKILCEVGRDLMHRQKIQQRHQRAADLRIDITRRTIRNSIGVKGQGADQEGEIRCQEPLFELTAIN